MVIRNFIDWLTTVCHRNLQWFLWVHNKGTIQCTGVPWAGPKLPSQTSLAGDWERHWAWTGGYLLHSMVCIATSTPLWWLYCNMRYFLHTYSVMQYYLQGMLMYNLLLKQNSCTRYFLCCCCFMASQIQKNPEIGHETRVQVKLGGDGPRFSHASSFILFSKTAKNVLSGHGKLFTL